MITQEQAAVFKQQVDDFIKTIFPQIRHEIAERMREFIPSHWIECTYSSQINQHTHQYPHGAYFIEETTHDELMCFLTCKTPADVVDASLKDVSVSCRSEVMLQPEFSLDEIEYRAAHIATVLIDTYVQEMTQFSERHSRIRQFIRSHCLYQQAKEIQK